MKKLFLVLILLLCGMAHAICTPGTNVYYISISLGSDSNSQTAAKSKSTPWAHAPKMASFTGTYSHTAGDCFVFHGGDTWSASTDKMVINAGGSSGAGNDYYGVDTTWPTSGWTRPILSGGNPLSTSFAGSCTHDFNNGSSDTIPISVTAGYVTIDNLEITGVCWSVTNYTFGSGIGFVDFSAGPGTVSNLYC